MVFRGVRGLDGSKYRNLWNWVRGFGSFVRYLPDTPSWSDDARRAFHTAPPAFAHSAASLLLSSLPFGCGDQPPYA